MRSAGAVDGMAAGEGAVGVFVTEGECDFSRVRVQHLAHASDVPSCGGDGGEVLQYGALCASGIVGGDRSGLGEEEGSVPGEAGGGDQEMGG